MKLTQRIKNILKRFLSGPEESVIQKILRGGGHVGTNVDILGSICDLSTPYLISIGNNVTITGSQILTHDASTKKALGYTKVGHVIIGNDVFIGIRTVILPNTIIGDKVIVGAGCVVSKDIPSNSVVVGNPMRQICSYDEYMEKMKRHMSETVVIDCLPEELLNNSSHRKELNSLIEKKDGFVL